MAVNLPELGDLMPVPGVRIATAAAAIKASDRDDVAILALSEGSTVAGVFTQSSFRAAPVQVAVERISRGAVRALVINSGNANAATGEPGIADALEICSAVDDVLDIPAGSTIPFSTGVIGERLPTAKMVGAIQGCANSLTEAAWQQAARAIMTTDTAPKAVSRKLELGGRAVTITGMAKGSGMIKPDMATMLAYICCDAAVTTECLQSIVEAAAARSFNRITIDGDTSTNDAFVVCATGQAGNEPVSSSADPDYQALLDAVSDVARTLAQFLVRDGEGATKFVTIRVTAGRTSEECLAVAYAIAESPLVKTAMFAGDANWGRFCMAIGRAGVEDLDTAGVSLSLNEVAVAEAGLLAPGYEEAHAASVMALDEYEVRVGLGRGTAEEVVWTTDLSHDYVTINSEYRT